MRSESFPVRRVGGVSRTGSHLSASLAAPFPPSSACHLTLLLLPVSPGGAWSRGQEKSPSLLSSWHSGQLWGWLSQLCKALAT